MEKRSNDRNGKPERHVRHGGDAHQSQQKQSQGPVQGFSQAPKGLQYLGLASSFCPDCGWKELFSWIHFSTKQDTVVIQ